MKLFMVYLYIDNKNSLTTRTINTANGDPIVKSRASILEYSSNLQSSYSVVYL